MKTTNFDIVHARLFTLLVRLSSNQIMQWIIKFKLQILWIPYIYNGNGIFISSGDKIQE